MAKGGQGFRLHCLLYVLFLSINNIFCTNQDEERKVYIVHMGSLHTDTSGKYSLTSRQLNLLQEVIGEESAASASLVRSYKRSFNGFAAKLTEKEALKLASKEGVFSVFPSQTVRLQTTRSWDFIGVPLTASRRPTVESNTIIGVIDTGAYPMSESFSDKGFGPPPKKWKGSCKGGTNFTCNNKLIGARYYEPGSESVLDFVGHGTHTASTAAGSVVEGASYFGLANGTARGGVPSARIAVYCICDSIERCQADAILAAFDDAIADGVDIITASLAWEEALPFDQDVIAIGSFYAMSKGILVTQAAGNTGPQTKTSSVAPWVLTVAANSIDRRFITKLVLGDGMILTGETVIVFSSGRKNSALVFGKQVTSSCDERAARACVDGCLEMKKVAGKIVICDGSGGAPEAAANNASGVILRNGGTYNNYLVPVVQLDDSSFQKLVSYHSSTKHPRGRILKGETASDPNSPMLAVFSSPGPNMITPDIMKPDVSAPGIAILAAFPPNLPPTNIHGDHRSVKFNIISGTSMSCPHVGGAAAYVKTFHPKWSPSAIKSALMTTASKLRDGDEFSYGSGQINPSKALDPGLVYEIVEADYVNLLCSLGFNMRAIDSKITCPRGVKNMSEAELNYPSLIFKAPVSNAFNLELNRTVTNVGPPNSTYKARVASSSSVNITIIPNVLSFKSVYEKKSFTVKISGSKLEPGKRLFEEVFWSDDAHSVRSPIIVYTK